MIKNKWWMAAIDIRDNDYIELSKGNYERIIEVEFKEIKYPVKVYNLTVEDNHNYYIDEDEVLTHNTLELKKSCNTKGATEADIIADRVSGFDLTPKEKPYNILGSKKISELKAKIDNRTITKDEWNLYDWNKRFKNRRDAGVDAFWEQERQRILNGERTTRNWSNEQIEDILNNNVPKYNGKAITGHHSYSASKYPHLADKGEVIYPATFNEHLNKWHGRNYRNSNPGSPINPLYPDDF